MTVTKAAIRLEFSRKLAPILMPKGFTYRNGEFRRVRRDCVEGVGIQFSRGTTPAEAIFTVNLAQVPTAYAQAGVLCVYVDHGGTHGSQARLYRLAKRAALPEWFRARSPRESALAIALIEKCLRRRVDALFAKLPANSNL